MHNLFTYFHLLNYVTVNELRRSPAGLYCFPSLPAQQLLTVAELTVGKAKEGLPVTLPYSLYLKKGALSEEAPFFCACL
jgi:hypothetical protein